jgi:hypothetical protein
MKKYLVFLAFIVMFSLVIPLIQAQLEHETIEKAEIPIKTEYFVKDQTQVNCNSGLCLMVLKPIITYQINFYKIDPNIDVKIIDIIDNSVKFEIDSVMPIPFKYVLANKTERIETLLPLGKNTIIYKPEGNETIFGKRYVFGQNSTELTINSTDNIADVRVFGDSPDTTHENDTTIGIVCGEFISRYTYEKWNISQLLNYSSVQVLDANFSIYQSGVICNAEDGNLRIDLYHVYNDTWNEGTLTYNNQPCGINFNDSSNCNFSSYSTTITNINESGYYKNFSITNLLQHEYDLNDDLLSFVYRLNTSYNCIITQDRHAYHYSSEYETLKPFLSILFAQVDVTNPIVTLNDPLNNTWEKSLPITFNATGTDMGSGILNASLWHDCNGIWHRNATNYYSNQTQVEAIFNVNVADTSGCQWNVYFCDAYYIGSNCAFATNNFTLKIDTASPTIVFINQTPENEAVVPIYAKQLINFTITDLLNPIDSYWIEWQTPSASAQNITLNETYYRTILLTEIGEYHYKVYANDTLGNLGVSETRTFIAQNIETNVQIQLDLMKNLVITNKTCINENTLRITWGEEHTLGGVTDTYEQVQNQFCEWGCDYYAKQCRVEPKAKMINFLIVVIYFIVILFSPLLMITRKSKKKKLKFIIDMMTIFIFIVVYIVTITLLLHSLISFFGNEYSVIMISFTGLFILFPFLMFILFFNNIAKHRY